MTAMAVARMTTLALPTWLIAITFRNNGWNVFAMPDTREMQTLAATEDSVCHQHYKENAKTPVYMQTGHVTFFAGSAF